MLHPSTVCTVLSAPAFCHFLFSSFFFPCDLSPYLRALRSECHRYAPVVVARQWTLVRGVGGKINVKNEAGNEAYRLAKSKIKEGQFVRIRCGRGKGTVGFTRGSLIAESPISGFHIEGTRGEWITDVPARNLEDMEWTGI